MRRLVLTTSLLSVSLVTACSGQPAGLPYSPKFQLAQFDSPAGVAVKPTEGQKPTAKGTETLIVNIRQFLSKFRRVLAVPASINKVIVTVTAADGTVFTQILDLSALTSGQTSVTFNGLVPGEATILIEAYDASDKVIGYNSVAVTVMPGVVAQKDVGLPQNVASSPGSGGSGGSTLPGTQLPSVIPPGDLQSLVAIFDGPALGSPAPAILPWEGLGCLDFDSKGDIWTVGKIALEVEFGSVHKFSPSGSSILLSSDMEFIEPSIYNLIVDHDDNVWTIGDFELKLEKFSASGTRVGAFAFSNSTPLQSFPTLSTQMVVDRDNHIWLTLEDRLLRVSQTGAFVVDLMLPDRAGMLACDAISGALWAAPERGNWLIKVMPDGTHTQYSLAPDTAWNGNRMVVDASGNLYLPRRTANEILRIGANGSVDARIPALEPMGLAIDKAGQIWVSRPEGVFKLRSTGNYSEGYSIPWTQQITEDLAGNIWVTSLGQIYKISP